jgi:type VI protein secretion system component Hcp
MRDKDTKKRSTRISPLASEANTGTELGETELKDVTGGAGKVTMQDFHFTMKMNKASPA